MAVIKVPSVQGTAVQHTITAGSQFNGVASTGTLADLVNGTYKYASATVGGLFTWDSNEPMVVVGIRCHMVTGTTPAWTIKLVNLDGAGSPITNEAWVIKTATATDIWLDESIFKTTLLSNQAIQITTTSATGILVASVVAYLERGFQF